ncbi:MAG: hypothetical protein HPY79_00060 [Bacteroidales bacterium]|nr:hypothetical protein [Bacteroidales bacterium]
MKKLFAISLIVLAGAAMFTSCKKDETKPAPEITVTNNKTAYTVTATADTTITFNVTVTAEAEIDQFTIKKTVGSTTTSYGNPSGFAGQTSYTYNFQEVFHPTDTYPISFTFKVVDKEGQEASITVTVSKVQGQTGTPFGAFNSYTAVLMGGQNNATTGSFYASVGNHVYTLSQAAANSASVDFAYYYGSTNLATLSAPADPQITSVANFSTIANWQTRNNTLFVKNPSVDFANISTTTDISGVTFGTDLKANQLSVGDVVAFKTAAGKIGFVKVTAITQINGTNSEGTITIDVKVQQ